MNKFVFSGFLMVFIAAPVWGDSLDDLGEVTAELKSLIEPMAQKVEDCDEQVAEAEIALAETKSKLNKVFAVRDKVWQNVNRLKSSLLKQGSKIEIEGEFFCREAVARAMEKLVEKYESTDTLLRDLEGQATAQQIRLQESLAKQQRWRNKETELLDKISTLQKARDQSHDDGSRGESETTVQQAAKLQTEVERMLRESKGASGQQANVSRPKPASTPRTVAGSNTQTTARPKTVANLDASTQKPTRARGSIVRQNASKPSRPESHPIPNASSRLDSTRAKTDATFEINIDEVGEAWDGDN